MLKEENTKREFGRRNVAKETLSVIKTFRYAKEKKFKLRLIVSRTK